MRRMKKMNNAQYLEMIAHARNLADALLEVRELVSSGSEEMMIIDEALSKVEIKPYKQTIPPDNSSRKKKSTLLYEHKTYAVNQAKWEAARKVADKKGMEFIILTENELNIK